MMGTKKIRRFASTIAGKVDAADLLWLVALVCVVAGTWRQFGEGIGLIVAGLACGFLALAFSDGRGLKDGQQ